MLSAKCQWDVFWLQGLEALDHSCVSEGVSENSRLSRHAIANSGWVSATKCDHMVYIRVDKTATAKEIRMKVTNATDIVRQKESATVESCIVHPTQLVICDTGSL